MVFMGLARMVRDQRLLPARQVCSQRLNLRHLRSLICWDCVISGGTPCFGKMASAISTACSWCGIIVWANFTSASLKVHNAEPAAVEPESLEQP